MPGSACGVKRAFVWFLNTCCTTRTPAITNTSARGKASYPKTPAAAGMTAPFHTRLDWNELRAGHNGEFERPFIRRPHLFRQKSSHCGSKAWRKHLCKIRASYGEYRRNAGEHTRSAVLEHQNKEWTRNQSVNFTASHPETVKDCGWMFRWVGWLAYFYARSVCVLCAAPWRSVWTCVQIGLTPPI